VVFMGLVYEHRRSLCGSEADSGSELGTLGELFCDCIHDSCPDGVLRSFRIIRFPALLSLLCSRFLCLQVCGCIESKTQNILRYRCGRFSASAFGLSEKRIADILPFSGEFFGQGGFARFLVSIYKYVIAFLGMAVVAFLLECVRHTRFYIFLCWVGTMTLDIYVCHHYFLNMGLGSGFLQYFSAAVLAFIGSLILTLLILRRFRITRVLLLGQNR